MARNGSGTMTLAAGNPVVTSTSISSTVQNNTMTDIANEITNSLPRDGQAPPTANLPMGNFRHTGVADATQRTNYASFGQVQDNIPIWGGTAGGTADALTIGPAIAVTAYATGQRFDFIAASANATTTPTIVVSALTAKTIKDRFGNALAIGDIQPGLYSVVYDGTNFRLNIEATNSFEYKLSGAQTSGNIIIFDGAEYTQQGSGYNSTTGVYTCPVAGLYRFNYFAEVDNSIGSTLSTRYMFFSINGATTNSFGRGEDQMYPIVNGSWWTFKGHMLRQMAAGDTVSVRISAALSGAGISASLGSFSGQKIKL